MSATKEGAPNRWVNESLFVWHKSRPEPKLIAVGSGIDCRQNSTADQCSQAEMCAAVHECGSEQDCLNEKLATETT